MDIYKYKVSNGYKLERFILKHLGIEPESINSDYLIIKLNRFNHELVLAFINRYKLWR